MKDLVLLPCDCEKWQRIMPILQEQQTMAQIRGYVTTYPDDGIFTHCPWCGKKREEDE